MIMFTFATMLFLAWGCGGADATRVPQIGAWVYDTLYPQGPSGHGVSNPGMWLTNLTAHNAPIKNQANRINTVYTYGSDLEMYCLGSGGSSPSTPCSKTNMLAEFSAGAQQAAETYGREFSVVLIVDGEVTGQYLSAFNNNPQATVLLADKLAENYCASNVVSGLALDLEPFNLALPGQLAFYQRLAANLNSATFGCLSSTHPSGRTLSVFAGASSITTADWQQLSKILTNGWFILSGYDLGPNPAGDANTPAKYGTYLEAQISVLLHEDVSFVVALPFSASVHEFESQGMYGQASEASTGYTQADYIAQAVQSMASLKVRHNPKYLGPVVWTWTTYLAYPSASSHVFNPSTPAAPTLDLLKQLRAL